MFQLRRMTESDLPMVLEWRNQPEIRKNMYTQHEITREEHFAWFARIKNDPSKQFFICLQGDTPVGVINFVDINPSQRTASWGFYSGDISKRGIGTQMEYLALNYAFGELGLEKLNCEVLSSNYSVVSFHRKFGFRIEGLFKRHFYDGQHWHDVYRLAMFRKDWLERLQPVFKQKLEDGKAAKHRLDVGASYKESFILSSEQIEGFASVSGDNNPIHLSDDEAQKQGFPGVIAHGFLVGSIFSKILGTQFPGPGTIYTQQTLKFVKPVRPDMSLVASVKVISRIGNRLILETRVSDVTENLYLEGEAEVLVPVEA